MSNAISPAVSNYSPVTDPTLALLLNCARTKLQPPITAQIQDRIQQGPDWEKLVAQAQYHGLLPLLYQTLQTLFPETVPPEILEKLRHYAQSTALRSAIYTKELLNICQLFEENGIRVLPFKGPVLAIEVYGDLGLRQFSDLDLWVHPQDSAAAIKLLTEHANYVEGRQWRYLNTALEQRYQRSWRECSLKKGSFAIDLHQQLTVETFLSTSFSFDESWENRQYVEISSYAVPSFCPEDLLLYLSVHGSKECWRGLKWICDLSECMQAYIWDWDVVLEHAQQKGCERRLLIGLSLVNQLLGIELPDPVQSRLVSDPVAQNLAQMTLNHSYQQETSFRQKFSWQKFKHHVQSVERRQDQWQSLKELWRVVRSESMVIFPNNYDQEALPLPHSLQWLHFVIRPFRLIGQQFGRSS